MRKIEFANDEFYHIYNRGVDKRIVFKTKDDVNRFLKGIVEFNVLNPIGSLYENREHKRGSSASTIKPQPPLVEIVAYCINPNHYHLLLKQVIDKGVEKFMHRLGTGYSKYFNLKNKRSGTLFEGKYKAKYIDSNEYLLHLSAYVNLNHFAHHRGSSASTGVTSWDEYMDRKYIGGICKKEIILGQFKSRGSYKKFAEGSLKSIVERKILLEELEEAGVELVNTK